MAEAPAEEPADLLSADLTATDTLRERRRAARAVVDEPFIEEPTEEQ